MEDRTNEYESSTWRQWHTPVILVIAVVLLVSNIYFYWDHHQLQQRLRRIQNSVESDLQTLRENTASSAQTTAKTLEELRTQLDDERGRAMQAANQAAQNARRHADDLAAKIQTEHAKAQEQVASALGEVKEVASTRIAEVASHVNTVDTQVAQARSELDKTVAELRSVRGDLGVQSGLIATNAKELAALRALGERNYVEFNLAKTNKPQRVGAINVVLRKADPKRSRFTIDVIADDKKVEKKDRTINEPVQFYVSRARQPYELVVNEVQKDRIVGYLGVPKVETASR
jgi:F0F1-type ATP synthase membrane subunit b/b'